MSLVTIWSKPLIFMQNLWDIMQQSIQTRLHWYESLQSLDTSFVWSFRHWLKRWSWVSLFTTPPPGQLTSTDLNILSWQDQPKTMFTFINLHRNRRLRRKKKAISLSPRLPCESGSHSLSSVSSKSAEWLICCVRLAIGREDNVSEKMQRWQPITTTAHILLPTLTTQIKTPS